MKFKLDENLGRRGLEVLRSQGYDVCTVADQHMCSATDATLLEVCRAEGRCLVTLDLDFANPLRFNPATSPGIAVLRPPPRASLEDLIETLRTLCRGLETTHLTGKLWIVQRGRIREHQSD